MEDCPFTKSLQACLHQLEPDLLFPGPAWSLCLGGHGLQFLPGGLAHCLQGAKAAIFLEEKGEEPWNNQRFITTLENTWKRPKFETFGNDIHSKVPDGFLFDGF